MWLVVPGGPGLPAAGETWSGPCPSAETRSAAPAAEEGTSISARAARGLPLAFVPNVDQWSLPCEFAAERGGQVLLVDRRSLELRLLRERDERTASGVALRLVFEGASPEATVLGERPLPGVQHYLLGQDRSRWRTGVPRYAQVRIADLLHGVDVVVYGNETGPEYDLELDDEADLSELNVTVEGATDLSVHPGGALVMQTAFGPVTQSAPRAWQVRDDGSRRPVDCTYRVQGATRFGFVCEGLEPGRGLVVDPGLTWGTYLGKADGETGEAIAVLGNGDVVIAGRSGSLDYPVTPGAFLVTSPVTNSVVTRLSADGASLVYSTFLGGTSASSWLYDAVVRSDESVTVAGDTEAPDFPVTPGCLSPTYNGGLDDMFIAQLDATGSTLLYGTYLGGALTDRARGVDLDAAGRIVVGGWTMSPDFPLTPGAFDTSLDPFSFDGAVALLDPAATGDDQLVWSTLLGGAGTGEVHKVVVTPEGSVVALGYTGYWAAFPLTPDAFDASSANFYANFVTRLSADGASLEQSTLLEWNVADIALDASGALTFAGTTAGGLPYPSPGGYDLTANGSADAFVGRLDPSGTALEWLTLLGGSGVDVVRCLALDAAGNVLVGGDSTSANWPVTCNALDGAVSPGGTDAVVALLAPDGKQLLYGSYLGTSIFGSNLIMDVDTFGPGEAALLATAYNWMPVTPGAFDELNEGEDMWVGRLVMTPWADEGGALAGAAGEPDLSGAGPLCAGSLAQLRLQGAAPLAPATLVLGFGALGVPFKGGTLVPAPDLLLPGFVTDATGAIAAGASWPAGVPAGFELHAQWWIADAAGPAGYSASNGVLGVVP